MFKTPNIMLLMGGDFYYTNYDFSLNYLQSIEKIIKAVDGINIKFATPSEYFDAVFSYSESFKLFEGDLLPYVSPAEPYDRSWTGFFSTKPVLKKSIYNSNRFVRTAEIFQSLINNKAHFSHELNVCSHHDAITGTCRKEVYYDYLMKSKNAYKSALQAIGESLESLITPSINVHQLAVPYKIMFLINPLNWEVRKVISVIGEKDFLAITDGPGNPEEAFAVKFEGKVEFFFMQTLKSFEVKVLFIQEFNEICEKCSAHATSSITSIIKNKHLSIVMDFGLIDELISEDISYKFSSKLVEYKTDYSGLYLFTPVVRFI